MSEAELPNTPSFAELGLPEPLLKALTAVGYETPSPIQAAAIPPLLQGNDLIGQAQTGTGKTAAFALPLLARLRTDLAQPQLLVLTPTRELAIQVAEALLSYARFLPGFHVLPMYGGQSIALQLKPLKRGVQVIVGTPGRVIDHIERKSLNLDALSAVVLDEADEMLRMGFIDDVEWILQHTPATRQTALFSATMPDAIRRVANRYLTTPKEIKIKSTTSTAVQIRQRYWLGSGAAKIEALTRILEVEEDIDATLIFVRTKTETVAVAEKLEARGHAVAALNGDLTQALRERVIEQLKSGKFDIVVATDVAARGLDVPRITHVINYDIPYDSEAYVHRIGRTGRAGRSGEAILFVAPREMRMLRTIERATRQPIEAMHLPSSDELSTRRRQRLRKDIEQVFGEQNLDFFREVVQDFVDNDDWAVHDLAAALLYLAQKDKPLVPEHSPTLARQPSPAQTELAAPGRRVRGERAERAERTERAPKRGGGTDAAFVTYQIGVGREQLVAPKDIVGALANEAGIAVAAIGRIRFGDHDGLIELAADTPAAAIAKAKRLRIRQHPLGLTPTDADIDDLPARRSSPTRAKADNPYSSKKITLPRSNSGKKGHTAHKSGGKKRDR